MTGHRNRSETASSPLEYPMPVVGAAGTKAEYVILPFIFKYLLTQVFAVV